MTAGKRLLALVRPYTLLFVMGMVATVLSSVFDGFTFVLLIPFLRTLFGQPALPVEGGSAVEAVLDRIVGPFLRSGSPDVALRNVVVVLLVALVLKNVMHYAHAVINVAIQEGVVRDLRVALVRHMQILPLGFFHRTKGGQLLSRVVNDADQVKTAVSAALASLLQNAVIIMVYLAILLALSWRLTLVALALAPVLLVVIRPLLRKLRRRSREIVAERGEVTSRVAEMVQSVKLVRAYVAEDYEAGRFREVAERYRKRVLRAQRYSALTHPISEVFGGLMLVTMLWFGTRLVLRDPVAMQPEVLMTFLAVALRLMSPLKSVANFPTVLTGAVAAAERVFEVLDLPADEGDRPGEEEATFRERLEYREVTFAYEPEVPVVRDVSFTVCRGEVLALVGPSGAGKTTVVDLLPRFYEPEAGVILLDGVPITRYTRRSLRRLMGIVSQETVVLNDSVTANIAYGLDEVDPEQVREAARAANAHDFIAKLPDGYDTILGDRGTRLSGGQRQRIAIARALLRDPPILILDEATSALDTESERLVQSAIDRLMEHRTVLVIAHRLATVQHADAILVLQDGRVVERGTHDELHAAGGLYRRLHDLQFRT